MFGRKKNRNQSEAAPAPEAANGLSAREIAELTARKIDEIESEMVREGVSVANPAAQATAKPAAAPAQAQPEPAAAMAAGGGATDNG
ncbi:MAG: hypothetical protein D8H96_04605, partial [Lautropia sp.]